MVLSTYWFSGALIATVASQESYPCWVSIDLVFLQDSTGSFEDDLPNVLNQLPAMMSAVNEQNPNSWFGVADFKDKPIFPLGELGDYCYQLNGPLSNDTAVVQHAYSQILASGGRDLPEAQFQALINSALDPAVGWRPIDIDVHDGSHSGARVIVLSTDAQPHLPGDVAKAGLPPLETNPGNFAPDDLYCRTKDYPSPQQVKDALDSMDIYLAILTPHDGTDNSVEQAWRWLSESFMGEPADFLQFIQDDSSDLLEGLLKAIKAVTQTVCARTTEAPTTRTVIGSSPPSTTEVPATSPTTHSETAHWQTSSSKTTTLTTVTEETSPCSNDPCPGVVIKAWERPHKLYIDYQK